MVFRLIHPNSQLLRSSKTLAELHEGATGEIHAIISKTADAYEEASHLSPACTSAAYHARFLRELVAQDTFRSQQQKGWEDGQPRCKRHRARYVIDGTAHEIIFTPQQPHGESRRYLQTHRCRRHQGCTPHNRLMMCRIQTYTIPFPTQSHPRNLAWLCPPRSQCRSIPCGAPRCRTLARNRTAAILTHRHHQRLSHPRCTSQANQMT